MIQLFKKKTVEEKILSYIKNPSQKERGFKLLYDTYREKIYWHIFRMCESHADTDDVLQNTFVKVYKAIDRFEGKSALYTWLFRIATNESITFLNKRNKTYTVQIDDEESSVANRLYAEEEMNGDELKVQLAKAIDNLPEKQRKVFNMRYYDEMSYKQMSELLGTSEGGLKASYHHAVKKIETFFKEELNLVQ